MQQLVLPPAIVWIACALTALASSACQQGMPHQDPIANGRWLAAKDCGHCHGAADTSLGPTLLEIAGREVLLDDGTRKVRDRAYLERAVTDPWSELREGWGKTMLPLRYDADELAALVAWLEAGAPPE